MALVESKAPKLDRLARTALDAYDLREIRLRLLEQKKNSTFRVDAREPGNGEGKSRFVLRVCEEGDDAYDEAELGSELIFLRALRKATGLVVPDPLRTRDGSWVVRRTVPDRAESRLCVLFRWVPGRMVEDAPTPERLEKVGELLARIHAFSRDFEPPEDFVRPRWDARGLFGDGPVLQPGQGKGLVSDRARDLLDEAARRIREEMAELGEGPEVFGIVHKDLEPDNTLIDGDRIHAIDFADCGWGYYLYDIASALLPLKEKPGFEEKREALLRGYRRVRPLAAEHVAKLETFLVARGIFASRLMLGKLWDLPQIRSYAESAVPQILGGVRRFLEQTGSADGSDRTRTTIRFLSHVRSVGIKLWNEGDRLRFEAPKGVMTPELLEELKERKAEILGFLRQGASAAPPLEPVPESERGSIPLSFAQQRLWFIDRLVPESPAYNIARALRLTGRVRVRVVAQSLVEITRRHESLRTSFTERDGEPVQVVADRADLRVPLVDLSGLPEDRRQGAAHELSLQEARRPFDLERGPLLRVFLTRLSLSDHIGPSSMHHIVGDGWSSGMLFQELGQIYGAFAEGRPTPFPELPIQYPDFAVWQRKWLRGEVLEDQLAYWRDHLAGAPQLLELPTDRPRSASTSQRSTRERGLLPAPLVDRLKSFAQARGATLFMILLATFKVLLYRHTGQRDLLVGSPIANRNRAEVEGLIGFFANTLVLRTRLHGETRFRDLLEQVRQTTLGAYAHQDLPFEKIVEELRPNRTVSDTPLFQVAFTLQNVPSPDMRVADFRMSLMPPTSRSTPFDLNLNMKEMPEGVRTSWNYKRDLFDATTIRRLARHFSALLEAVVETPDLGAAELRMLSLGERHQLLRELNDTDAALPEDSLAKMFEARVRRGPEAPAVVTDDGAWSYRRLDDHARRLSRALRSRGVTEGELVGVSSRRSPELIAGLLAVVRLGAAYVPLDPEYPEDRLRFMVEETAIRTVLVDGEMETRLAFLGDRRLPLDGTEWEPDDAQPAGSPEHVAYVIYTSGSTGRPKGTAVPQRAVVRLVRNTDFVHLGPDDRTAHMSNTSFDAATFEIWGALLNGGALVVLDRETVLSPPAFVERLRRHEVSAMFVTVSLFNQVVRDVPDAFRTVRSVLFGGEAADPGSVRRCLEAGPPERLLNGYGPTETTTFACTHLTGHVAPDARTVPIGRPIANTSVHVLDRSGRPTALGVGGELYIGGPGLGLGYLRRPGRTAQRFVPHPVAVPTESGQRLYRTGDRVRRRPSDGAVEFLGRFDDQVKIRGFRIEPGEIAVALEAHPAVAEAAVKVWEVGTAERRLAAYVVRSEAGATGAADVAEDALRKFLADRLPDFMVPKIVAFLASMPLTANGKLDRAALPEPDWGDTGEAVRLPESSTEELVAGIWKDVLNLDRVGADHDFFDLGGHSLLATQVLSRVREVFEVELPLQALFDATTVEDLARTVDEAIRRGHGLDEVPLEPVDRSGALPLSFAQQRLWFLDRLEPGNAVYNIPAAIRLEGPINGSSLEQAFLQVVGRHEVLRSYFPERGDAPVQAISPRGDIPLRRVDLTRLGPRARKQEKGRLLRAEAGRGFDIACGPLIRFALLRLASQTHVLLTTMHHIVSDGWSVGILLEEIAHFHETFHRGTPPSKAPLPIQYADFAVWQRRWLAGEALRSEIDYWREQLDGMPERLDLATDRPRPKRTSSRGASVSVRLKGRRTDALCSLARCEDATPFMVLLAALNLALARYGDARDVVVGSPIAGRSRRELEPLVGFFVNTLVLRTDLSGRPTVRELLHRTRQVALAAFAHQHLPFERLVEEIAPDRDLTTTSLFQVMLVLQNTPSPTPSTGELSLAFESGDTARAKFDLTVFLTHGEEGLEGSLTYRPELFDKTTMERFRTHWLRLLEAFVAHPNRRIDQLPHWSEAELHQLQREWNDTVVPCTAGRVEEVVLEVAGQRPDAVAVVYGEECLTYGELVRQADRWSARLIELGVGIESRVGVRLDRSLELPVVLLGILRAGALFAPLDPEAPVPYIHRILAHSRVRWVISRPAPEGARELPGAERVVVQPGHPLSGSVPKVRDVPRGPKQGAYVIHTSGSTGEPKGVLVSHEALVNHMDWVAETYPLRTEDSVLHKTPFTFDPSIGELFAPWWVGARLVLDRDGGHREPDHLVRRMLEEGSVTLQAVPSLLEHLVQEPDLGRAASLRRVYSGGENLTGDLATTVRDRLDAELCNVYGPAEATIHATAWTVDGSETGRSVPIGRPIRNVRALVVDRDFRSAPPGVPGELVVGGVGLARGYVGRPGLTALRFVPDGWASEPGARLYRTGDLVRSRPSGELVYQGRLDQQVKLRGHRIEPGELEAVLARHPAVERAVSIVREDRPGDRRLVAYVTLLEDLADAGTQLRDHLSQRLPTAYVPSTVEVLETFPELPSGKVDRRALPEPGRPESTPGVPTEPRSPEEELVASVWADVLGLERVGVHDDFFASGGHSLLATRVVARVRRAFDVDLPLTRLFESPTVAGLARAVAAARRAGRDSLIPPLEPLAGTRSGDPVPLSFAQERVWFFESLDPARPAYNLPAAIRLRGDARAEQVAHVFREVVRRHQVLRTRYPAPDGTPRQEILDDPAVILPWVDLSGLRDRDRRDRARRLARAEGARPFDLTTQTPLRLILLRLGDDEHLLLSTFHHIASDAWSTARLLDEVSALHEAFGEGRPSPLAELPLQYADFAVWQRSWLRGEVLDAEVDHARKRLEGAPEVLDLPTDRPRPATPSYQVGTRRGELSPELRADLGELVRAAGITPFMVLLGAFQVLLGRWTGRRDVLVGSPVAGRPAEAEDLIGFFVNTLVLRGRLHEEQSFEEHLGAVRRDALDAYDHQALPFERLVEALTPRRDLSRPPLVQVLLVFQNAPHRVPGSGSLRLEPVGRTRPEGAVFDLTLVLEETSDGAVSTALHFARDLFDATTAERFLRHFRTLLRSVVSDPRRALAEHALWNPQERHQVLVEWNDATAPPREADTILEILDRHVRRRPDAVALAGGGAHVTYGELCARTRRLARVLRDRGIQPEEPVGLAVGRSPDRVVGLVGILRSGGAFLPLDLDYPPGRLLHMVRDAGVRMLVADSRGAAVLGEANLPVVPPSPPSLEGPPDPVSPTVAPNRLAYLIYTSGSTGRPKGVVVPHRGLAHVVAAQRQAFGVGPESRVLQFSTPGFDASVFETVMALGSGATLCLGPPDAATPGEPLTNLLRRQQVTVVTLTPSTLGLLPGPSTLPALATVTVAGEACPRELVDRWAPGRRFFNLYGPTETTIWATTAPCSSGATGRPSIGRPVPHAAAMVLDRTGRPVPLGVRGELVVTGDGVTRGYLGRPARTARSFVPDALTGRSGERLYRTGDVARWRADGRLDFLGRVDRQVQVRGVRVELGEVEAALTALPKIVEAAAVLHGERSDAARLVAYVVTDEDREIDPEAMRSALGDRLPEVMIPSIFVPMDRLPRMPSGKVDRKALPAPERSRASSGSVAPRTPLERELAEIWRDVLDTGPIGIHDDFFALGGQSLLAVRLAARLRSRFGREIPVSELFGRMTVERLAARLAGAAWDGAGEADPPSPVVSLRSGSGAPLILAHPAGGGVGRYTPVVERLAGLFPVLGLRAPAAGEVAGDAEVTTLEEQVSRYVDALQQTVPEGPYRLAGWSTGGVVAFETARRLVADGHVVDLLALLDTQAPGSVRQRLEAVDETTLVHLFARDVLQVPVPEGWGSEARGDPLESLGNELQIEPGVLRERFAGFRRQLELLDAYDPRAYPGRVDLVCAGPPPNDDDPRLGWRRLVTGILEIHPIAATHREMLEGDAARHVAQILSTRIQTLDRSD